ncbi:glycosyltransferase family 4 protein [Psychroserpens mesophilus]|uniref:glycosyltransferase family 4 protein n=1 Tax=Psychroserpens mesophilus TaxID=325473 RepID=UPI003D659351
MRKKRLGLVLSDVPGYSETFFRNKIKGLQESGFEVILFVDQNQTKNIEFPCEIVTGPNFNRGLILKLKQTIHSFLKAVFINSKASYSLYKLDQKDGVPLKKRIKHLLLNQFLLSNKLDWLHYGFGMLAVNRENIAQAIGAKMAVSFRGFDLYLSPLKHKACYELLFTKKVYYHVLSNQMKNMLNQKGITNSKIKVITPAIDVSFFQPKENTPINQRVEILTIARLHWVKGLEYTLEALSLLKKEGLDFKYTIIGEGEEYERLIFAAHQLAIKDQVVFKGKTSPENVKKELQQADIYIQYSIQEGFGNAVLEAQASGLLCVVSDAGGLRENVLDTKTGWVVPKRNPRALANTIQKVIDMTFIDQQKIQENAINRIEKEFHLKQQQQSFVKFYSED